MRLRFRAIHDEPSGSALRHVLDEYWPAYRRWIHRAPHRTVDQCISQLHAHMPELVPVLDQLLEAHAEPDQAARFLTLYDPPRVVRGCSQLVLDDHDGPVLVRSYEHHPDRFDATVVWSRWTHAPTLAMGDCLWGALDGLNAHGLALALAFGGRDAIGPGFAAPMIVRYLLETCTDVAQARAALDRLPVYMPYTFVAADARGSFVTAYLAPDRPARFVTRRSSTNHQGAIEWPAYCRHVQSTERLTELESLLERPHDPDRARRAFLRSPLWRDDDGRGSRTLYVAAYRPTRAELTLSWPDRDERFSLHAPDPRRFDVDLPTPAAT